MFTVNSPVRAPLLAGAGGNSGGSATAEKAPQVLVPFTKASREHTEGAFVDNTVSASSFGGGPTQIGPFDIPAFGYMRSIDLLVTTDGNGVAGLNNAVSQADAPWNVIRSVVVKDVNGQPIAGPFTGYDLMLLNKWGGYSFDGNPVRHPSFVDIDNDGEFSFRLRIPVEIVSRNALGALANMNASSTYKLEITVADDADVYSTAPDTLPAVRFRTYLEAWAPPSAQDARGNPQETEPRGLGTTQYWSKATYTTSVGSNTLRLARVGNLIRTLIFVVRDDNNAREGADAPDPIQIHLDGRIIHNEAALIRRDFMAERYGYELAPVTTADDDEGVFVYDFSHDFDGKPGGELGDLWLPTVQSTRFEFVGSISNTAGTLDVLTNDIAPVGALF